MAIDEYIEYNDRPDLYEEDPKDYFHFPCGCCKHRGGDQNICEGCKYYCV